MSDLAAQDEALLAAFIATDGKRGAKRRPRRRWRMTLSASVPALTGADRARMTSELEGRWENERRDVQQSRPGKLLRSTSRGGSAAAVPPLPLPRPHRSSI